MNYFKLLLCALLAIPSASFAMQEPIEPKNDQQLQLLINAGVDGKQKCMGECHKKAKYVPGDSLRITGCCWQFICAHDAETITKDCPQCHKKSSVHKIALSNETASMRFLDTNGVELKISNYTDYQALMKCETIRMLHADANGVIDMRNNHPWISTANIQLLAEYIKNPRIICNQSIDRNKDMLQLANFLMTPENILFELSNVLWEHLEGEKTDSQEVKEEKTQLRGIAEPYLHCPAYLDQVIRGDLEYLFKLQTQGHNLSYETIKNAFDIIRNGPWVEDKKGDLYNASHKFVTLRGLNEFARKLRPISHNDNPHLNLSGHGITKFSLKDVRMYPKIDISDNSIDAITLNSDRNLPQEVNLSNNKIASLDNTFFDAVKKHRSLRSRDTLTLDLRNNKLSDAQKKEIEKKMHKANHTWPERVNWNVIKKCITYPLYFTIPIAFAYTNVPLLENSKFSKSDVAVRTIVDSFTGATIVNYCSNVITDGSGEYSYLAGLCLGGYAAEGFSSLIDPQNNHWGKIVAGSMFATACLSTAAFPLLVKLRNKMVDSSASRLARITHPKIEAETFSDLENAKRVIVKL